MNKYHKPSHYVGLPTLKFSRWSEDLCKG